MSGKAKYILGDSRKLKNIIIRHNIPSPDLIVSSPPYFDLLDYDGAKDQIGFGTVNYETYLHDVANIFQNCFEFAKPDATLWLIIDTFKKRGQVVPLPFDINRKLHELFKKTWNLKEVIIWDKEKNLPWNSKGRLKNQFEYILFFTKGNKYTFNIDKVREINDLKKWWLSYPERYNPIGKAPSNLWQFTTPIRGWGNGKQNHFCPFPFALVEKIISIASNEGDVVFDPFLGSGSVIALAEAMGRDGYGVDINKKYRSRFDKEVLKGALDYWSARVLELNYNETAIKNFKSTNQKLRKLKVASHIALHINEVNKKPSVYLLADQPGAKFDFFIIENGSKPNINISDDVLKSLVHQSKVIPNIEIIADSEIAQRISHAKLYKYNLEKFYAGNGLVNRDNILDSKEKFNYFFSDIQVKVK
jgi:DNA modification methylase